MHSFALAFLKSARISRADLYGATQDPQLPINLVEDARIPFLGFAGERYLPGGVVLLAINPGGGGNAYCRLPRDIQLLSLIEAFIKSSPETAGKNFDAMSNNYAEQAQAWNLWRILFPILQACGKELNEVTYLNCFPYRTKEDRMPQAAALRASWAHVVKPLLTELKPSILVALGKKAGGVAARQFNGPGKLFIVPRTIGDTYLSEEAKVVLDSLRQHATLG